MTTAPYGIKPPALAVATTRSDAVQVFGEEFDDLQVTSHDDFSVEYDAESHSFVGLVVGAGADGTLTTLADTLEAGSPQLTVAVAGAPLEMDERDRLAAVVARMSSSASCRIQTYGGRNCLVLSRLGEPSHLAMSDVSAMLDAVSSPEAFLASGREDGFAESAALRRLSEQVRPLRTHVAQLEEELAAARQHLARVSHELGDERALVAHISEPTIANAWRAATAVITGHRVDTVAAGSLLKRALAAMAIVLVLVIVGLVAVATLAPEASLAMLMAEVALVLSGVTVAWSRRLQGSVTALTAEIAGQRDDLRRSFGRHARTARAVEARDRQARERLEAVEKQLRGLRVRLAEVATSVRPGLDPDGTWRPAPVVASLGGFAAATPAPSTLEVLLEELPPLGSQSVCGDSPSTARWLADAVREHGLDSPVTTVAELAADTGAVGGPDIGLVWLSAAPGVSVTDRLAPYADVLAARLAPRSVVVADVHAGLSGQADDLLALLPAGFIHCPTKSSTTVVLRRDPV